MSRPALPFSDASRVIDYADETARKVPGLADLHRMTGLLLGEHAPRNAQVLVLGAGGGMELHALAVMQPEWRFTGVDPSAAMLALARRALEPCADRVELVEGIIDAAPLRLHDGAVCLLTLHFLELAERKRTLQELHRRLRPGARLVMAHHSAPGGSPLPWLARSALFADREGNDRVRAQGSAAGMAARLHLLPVAEEEALLRDAGFTDVELFYAAFSFRGWVASAGQPPRESPRQ